MATGETGSIQRDTIDTEVVTKSQIDSTVPKNKTESSISTISSLSPEKHPLQNKWVLFYYRQDKKIEWSERIKKIIEFDSVEDFWAVYNHIKPPSQIATGCDYMIFKEGIWPMWEDKGNKNGGRWLLTLDKKRKEGSVDEAWMETLMCLVGEVFEEYNDDICGAVVQNRAKGDKLSIWTADATNDVSLRMIGKLFKEKLRHCISGKFQIQYQSHEDTATKSGSMSKSILTL